MTSHHVWMLILSHNSNKNSNHVNNKHNTTPLWGQNTPPHTLLPNPSVPLLPLTRGWRLGEQCPREPKGDSGLPAWDSGVTGLTASLGTHFDSHRILLPNPRCHNGEHDRPQCRPQSSPRFQVLLRRGLLSTETGHCPYHTKPFSRVVHTVAFGLLRHALA